jgi:dynein assembly factor 1
MTLNLSHNRIKRIENLACLPLLKNLDLSSNLIGANDDGNANPLECIEELKHCKALTSIDLSNNIMDCEHGVVEFFAECQNILCLYMKGNPCVRRISMYRKRLTYALKNLQYLDDRPVFDIERIAANAWSEGGAEAEKEARAKYQQDKIDKMKSYTARGRELTEEGKAKRKEQMRRMLESLKKDKDELIKKRDDLKALYKTQSDGDQQKQITYMKIKKIE